jgi:hypothetical protein
MIAQQQVSHREVQARVFVRTLTYVKRFRCSTEWLHNIRRPTIVLTEPHSCKRVLRFQPAGELKATARLSKSV